MARELAVTRRDGLLITLAGRESFVRRGFDYHEAELAAARAKQSEKARAGNKGAQSKLARIKGHGDTGARRRRNSPRLGVSASPRLFPDEPLPDANLAWHVRAWGQWVLERARRDLARFYPTYADFEPLAKDVKSYERHPMQLVPLKEDGTPDIDALNKDFSEGYLSVNGNPRWLAKPTVAYRLPAAPTRFRHGLSPGWHMHPVCLFMRIVGPGIDRHVGPAGQDRQQLQCFRRG